MEIALVTGIMYCVCVCWAVFGGFGVLSLGDCVHVMLFDKAWLPLILPSYQLAQVAAIARVYWDLYDMHVEMNTRTNVVPVSRLRVINMNVFLYLLLFMLMITITSTDAALHFMINTRAPANSSLSTSV